MAALWKVFNIFALFLICCNEGQAMENCILKADVVFIVDSSRSIWHPHFLVELDFVENITKGLNVGPDATHIGIINFSEGAQVEVYLNQLNDDLPALRQRIQAIRHMQGGRTDTYAALRLAREELFNAANGARSDVPHIIVIITDGVSSDRAKTIQQAGLVRERGIQTFVVGIGDLDVDQLIEMATSNSPAYVHTVSDFKTLDSVLPKILPAACLATTTTLPSTTTTTTTTAATITAIPIAEKQTEQKDESSKVCSSKKADVVFVLDKSSSITTEHFQTQLSFVNDLISIFNIAKDHTHVSVVTFDFEPKLEFGLLDYFSKSQVSDAVMGIEYTAGSTNTFLALEMVNSSVLTPGGGARPEVARVVIVVTDGKSSDEGKTKYWAEQLKKRGAYVFAIGVGTDADPQELTSIGSHPSRDYVFQVDGYSALNTIKDILAFRACEVPSGDLFVRCHNSKGNADIMFVTDFSNAGGRDVIRTTDIIKEVAGGVMTSGGRVRVGLTSNECPDVSDVPMARSSTGEEFSTTLTLRSGQGRLTEVLSRARDQLTVAKFGARSNVKRLAVVFVHGPITDLKSAAREVMRAKSSVNRPGVQFLFVGMGDRVQEKQLLQLASERDPRQVRLLMDNVGKEQVAWGDILTKVCEVLES